MNNEIKERREEDSPRKVKIEEYCSDDEHDEENEYDYQNEIARKIQKEIDNDNIVADAIDAYRDHLFYYNIFRPHITVWIEWYRVKYIKKGPFYLESDAQRDLNEFERQFNKMKKSQDMKRKIAQIWQ